MDTITISCPAGEITGNEDPEKGVRYFHSIPYSLIGAPFDNAAPLPGGRSIDATRPLPQEVALSVTTPQSKPLDDCPVIAYIHGGSYEHGSHHDPRSDGTANAQAGVITVHLGYRLGLKGFARFHDDPPAFYRGVDDCQLALEWIQENIESFGGDPTNVTLVGHSAGGGIALWLTRRDHYRGAYRRLLVLSPALPRSTYERRKWVLRQASGIALTRDRMTRAARYRPRALERGYACMRRVYGLDLALGPAVFDATELAPVPTVVSSMDIEFYDMPGAVEVDHSGFGALAARSVGRLMGLSDVSGWLHHAPPDLIMGKLVGDSTIRRWVLDAAEYGPEVWMMEFLHPQGHCGELNQFFGIVDPDKGLHAWIMRFARNGQVGWQPYLPDKTAMRWDLSTGERSLVQNPLGYLKAAREGEDR